MDSLSLGPLVIGLSLVGLLIYIGKRALPRRNTTELNSHSRNTEISQESAESEFSGSLTLHFFQFLLKAKGESKNAGNLGDEFKKCWREQIQDPTLFPRQPMVLPKLLQAMRAEGNNTQALVDIVLEDPGLTAEVLRLANSPMYRNTEKEIQSIDYAVVMLGIDGLHSLVCSSLMKPIFARRRGDGFNSSLFWDWALASAQSAQQYGLLKQFQNANQIYMLCLLTRLAELVILRLCQRIAKESATTNTPTEVLRVMTQYRHQVTAKLIKSWGFETAWIDLLPCEAEDSSILNRAQRLAPELGSAQILLNKKHLNSQDASLRLLDLGLEKSLVKNILL